MAENATMEVRARLTAETAQFTKGMQDAAKSAEQFNQTSQRLHAAMVGLGAVSAVAATAFIGFGVKAFNAAARVDELDIALQAVGSSSGLGYEKLNETAYAVKALGIETAVAQQSVLTLVQQNVDLAYATDLARAAQDLAVISQRNSTDVFNSMTMAIQTQNAQALRGIGVNTTSSQAFAEYAKTLGKSAKDLTQVEQKQAIVNAILKDAATYANVYTLAMTKPGKVLRSFPRLFNDMQVAIGDALLKGFGPLIYQVYEFTKKIDGAMQTSVVFKTIISALGMVFEKMTKPFVNVLKVASEWVDKLEKVTTVSDGVKSNFDEFGSKVKDLAGKIEFLLPAVAALIAGFASFGGAAIFANVPILGAMLAPLGTVAGAVTVAFLVLSLTSTQVKDAMGKLLVSLKPFISVLVGIGKAAMTVAAYGVSIFAKVISGLASGITAVTKFMQTHIIIAKALGAVVLGLVAGFVAWKTAMLLSAAVGALVTFVTEAIQVAQVLLSGTQLATIASTNGLAASMLALDATMGGIPLIIGAIVAGFVLLVAGFVIAWKSSDAFREGATKAINMVAKYVGLAISWILKVLGWFALGLAELMDTNNTFAKVVAAVYEFILDAVLFAIISLLKWYKWWLDSFVSLMKEHKNIADAISAIFEFIARVIGAALTAVLVYYANLIKGVATIIYYMGKLKDFIGEVWGKITDAIGTAIQWIGSIFSKLGNIISGIANFMKEKFGSVVAWLLDKAKKVPDLLMPDGIVNALQKLNDSLSTSKDAIEDYSTAAQNASVAKNIVNAQTDINKAITGTSVKVIAAAKGWGNYEDGIAGTLSDVANKILDFAGKVTEYASKVDGSKILGTIISGAEKASGVLGSTIKMLEDFKGKDVYKTLMDTASAGAKKAGDWLLATAATVESFTNSNFVEKVGESVGNFMDSLKTGLGFGDIMGSLKDIFRGPKTPDTSNEETQSLINSADKMKTIRDAMQQGIDSIKGVLDDLRNAAHDFANSLKDTIVGFAGLKGVELPDGFIPKAKSLIENMNQRLNKSMQFAGQIAQLQAMNLDAGALKDIIEAGPIKGAQLAASILGGGTEAVAQINSLQKAIEFSGAAIGQMGSSAAYSGLIANAQAKYDSLTGEMALTPSGNTVNISQGAFEINIDTSGMTTDEQLKAITDKIQETFAILAKELAAK